jgi:phage protein D
MAVADLRDPLVPAFDVIVNDRPMQSEARAHITSIAVDESTELPSMFSLVMAGSSGPDRLISWVDNDELFAIGNKIEIKLGYMDHLQTLIIGEITGLEPEFAHNRVPSLSVRGFDLRHRLQRGLKSRTFVQKKDSEIASQIAGDARLTPDVRDSETVHDYVLQHNQTDLEFLLERARRIQYEVVVQDKTLLFRPVGNAQKEVIIFKAGKSGSLDGELLEFHPRLVSGGQVSEVAVRGWDPKEKRELVGQAKIGDEASKMDGESSGGALAESRFGPTIETVSRLPVFTQTEADQMAKARFNSLLLQLITGDGLCRGRTDLRAGIVIKLDGLGKRFGGQYYVTEVNHRYSAKSGYQTHFSVRRNAS